MQRQWIMVTLEVLFPVSRNRNLRSIGLLPADDMLNLERLLIGASDWLRAFADKARSVISD
jgi:hypothetical protein